MTIYKSEILSVGQKSGIYFDLQMIFHDLNQRFFNQSIVASIKWGQDRKSSLQKKRSIRLGSYHPRSKTIVIHPRLDRALVPSICIERIIFHEMAHQRFPAKKVKGKTYFHYQEFNDFEKNYPYLKEADLWFKANLPLLLNS
jgi:predicted metal-dependent hydrolase